MYRLVLHDQMCDGDGDVGDAVAAAVVTVEHDDVSIVSHHQRRHCYDLKNVCSHGKAMKNRMNDVLRIIHCLTSSARIVLREISYNLCCSVLSIHLPVPKNSINNSIK